MKKLGGFPWGAFHICLRVSWVQIAGSVVCQIFRVVSQGKIVVGMLISSHMIIGLTMLQGGIVKKITS